MSARSSRTRVAPVPAVEKTLPKPVEPPKSAPHWVRWIVLAFAGAVLFCYFSAEVSDPDTWWHLKTGQYIVQQHKLPVPDPFAYTTYMWKPAYPGEEVTRRFNLTHEWLAQIFLYGTYALGGFPGLVVMRALWLTAFCGLAGWIVWRRTHGFYRAVAAALSLVTVLPLFATDRPQYVTYVFLALTVAILESRKRLWLLPPLLLVWANCHAGFFLGWVAMGAYCGEALFQRLRGKPPADEKMLWACSLGALAISGLNPNFFAALEVIRYYRQSQMQSQIWEWQYPKYWELSPFTVFLYSTGAMLLLNWRRTRPVDWILWIAFATAGLQAYRNIILTAWIGAVLIASYLPESREKAGVKDWVAVILLTGACAAGAIGPVPGVAVAALVGLAAVFWYGRLPWLAEGGLALTLAVSAVTMIAKGAIQPRVADSKIPEKTADFLVQHHIQGRMFNSYGQGGYLLWRLWPQMQVYVDGRALNEKVFDDNVRISMNAAAGDGASGEQLLKDYGIDVIVMDGFEMLSGTAYYLPAALADPSQKEWKLVYQDVHDVVYMRNPPPGVPVLNSLDALTTMEQQCQFLVEHGMPACSGGMWDVFTKIGDKRRADKWGEVYSHVDLSTFVQRKR